MVYGLAFNGFVAWCAVERMRGGRADHRSQIPDDPVGDLLMDGKAGAVFL